MTSATAEGGQPSGPANGRQPTPSRDVDASCGCLPSLSFHSHCSCGSVVSHSVSTSRRRQSAETCDCLRSLISFTGSSAVVPFSIFSPFSTSMRCVHCSTASMGPKFHAEPRRAQRGRFVTHLSPLGTLANVHSPRTLRLGVYFPPLGAHGGASAPRPSVLPTGMRSTPNLSPRWGW